MDHKRQTLGHAEISLRILRLLLMLQLSASTFNIQFSPHYSGYFIRKLIAKRYIQIDEKRYEDELKFSLSLCITSMNRDYMSAECFLNYVFFIRPENTKNASF